MRRRIMHVLVGCFLVIILGLVIYSNHAVIITGLASLAHANPGLICLGIILTASVFVCAAQSYRSLARRVLPFSKTFLVELAANAVNRIVPAGLGGLGIHGAYLYRMRHSIAQASSVVAVNNILGITGHLLLLSIVLISQPPLPTLTPQFHTSWTIVVVGCAVVLIGLIGRSRMSRFIREVSNHIRQYIHDKPAIARAGGWNMAITILTVSVLYICAYSLDVPLSWPACLIAYSVGVFLGTIIPTPGGIGGTEAGLYAAFTGYGITTVDAIALITVFRLLTYWLPLVPGTLAGILVRRQRLI